MRIFSSLFIALAVGSCGPSDAPPTRTESASSPAASEAVRDDPPGQAADDNARPVVVFFGTSLTAGLGLPSEDDTYVAHAAELAAAAGMPITAVNAGVSGETSAAGVRRLDWVLQRELDVLVLELGANDGLRGLPLDQLRENLVAIIRRTRTRHPEAQVVLVGMEAPPNMGVRYTNSFRALFREVAEDEQTFFLPFLLEGVAGAPELNQSDGIHPTVEGHVRMAENLMPVLMRAVEAAHASMAGASR
jgi:acyl-CoA thioesterase I